MRRHADKFRQKCQIETDSRHTVIKRERIGLNWLKEVPLLAILTRHVSSNFFAWVLVNMWVQFLKKITCYRPLKNRHCVRVCMEKMMDYQYRENSARNIYSNYNQMRAYVECSPNQSKHIYLIDLSIEESTKLWGFRNSAGSFCISILPKYCTSALLIWWLSLLYVYK